MAAYARQAVARSGSGFTVSGNNVTLAATATFPTMAGGAGGTVTHFGLGVAVSGGTELLFFAAVTPNITVAAGITPKLDTNTNVSQASSDAMANAAATNLLLLMFNNTNWANVGDATGLRGSSTAGSFYLSLHTASPAEAGNQSTNEISYT